jgi:methionyl-tRNA formyltransferase
MRIAFIGQQDFGKAALEAFLARGDEVVGVFCKPEKPGEKTDALVAAARDKGLQVFQFASLKGEDAEAAMRSLNADIGVMAYVLQFVPQSLVHIPKHGTIQYHPSLLPQYRGPSSINWPIARGDTQTGLSIFRPTDGLDEGPVILQKTCPIGPDATLGEVYFNSLFPLGVQALMEAADLVVAGQHQEVEQDESKASYEGWMKEAESRINWHNHVDQVYNLIRACNPAPGAWGEIGGQTVSVFDCRQHVARKFADVKGKPGEVARVTDESVFVNAQGGMIEIFKLKPQGGKKMSAAEFAQAQGWQTS